MNEQEAAERKRYVDAALEYISTPYRHMGMVKGAGVDCATLLICAGVDAGLIKAPKLDYYPQEWHLHRGSERYLATIARWCVEVPMPPLPGDIALWKFGRAFSHAAIVIEWPKIVHARLGSPCGIDDALRAQWLVYVGEGGPDRGARRPMKLVSHWRR